MKQEKVTHICNNFFGENRYNEKVYDWGNSYEDAKNYIASMEIQKFTQLENIFTMQKIIIMVISL